MILLQVFNRLLGTHNNESGVPHTSPITPAELLIALHNVDPNKAELKTVIKGTNLLEYKISLFQKQVLIVIIYFYSHIPLFCGETNIYARNGGCCNATSYGNDTAPHVTDANSNTEFSTIPKIKWIRYEYTSAVNSQTSLETAKSLGGFRKMLRTYATAKFRSHFTTSSSTIGRGSKNGKQSASTFVGACGSICRKSGTFINLILHYTLLTKRV